MRYRLLWIIVLLGSGTVGGQESADSDDSDQALLAAWESLPAGEHWFGMYLGRGCLGSIGIRVGPKDDATRSVELVQSAEGGGNLLDSQTTFTASADLGTLRLVRQACEKHFLFSSEESRLELRREDGGTARRTHQSRRIGERAEDADPETWDPNPPSTEVALPQVFLPELLLFALAPLLPADSTDVMALTVFSQMGEKIHEATLRSLGAETQPVRSRTGTVAATGFELTVARGSRDELRQTLWIHEGVVVRVEREVQGQLIALLRGTEAESGEELPLGPDDDPEDDLAREAVYHMTLALYLGDWTAFKSLVDLEKMYAAAQAMAPEHELLPLDSFIAAVKEQVDGHAQPAGAEDAPEAADASRRETFENLLSPLRRGTQIERDGPRATVSFQSYVFRLEKQDHGWVIVWSDSLAGLIR